MPFRTPPDGQGPPGECRTLLATCTAPHTAAVIGALGTVFRINPTGKETILHSFTGTDGQNPYDTLLQDHKGNLYGTSSVGGSGNGEGVVFKIAANESKPGGREWRCGIGTSPRRCALRSASAERDRQNKARDGWARDSGAPAFHLTGRSPADSGRRAAVPAPSSSMVRA
jgi:uncharacterized repeat protein (TIGR03803 family)